MVVRRRVGVIGGLRGNFNPGICCLRSIKNDTRFRAYGKGENIYMPTISLMAWIAFGPGNAWFSGRERLVVPAAAACARPCKH